MSSEVRGAPAPATRKTPACPFVGCGEPMPHSHIWRNGNWSTATVAEEPEEARFYMEGGKWWFDLPGRASGGGCKSLKKALRHAHSLLSFMEEKAP